MLVTVWNKTSPRRRLFVFFYRFAKKTTVTNAIQIVKRKIIELEAQSASYYKRKPIDYHISDDIYFEQDGVTLQLSQEDELKTGTIYSNSRKMQISCADLFVYAYTS